ncbi:glycosyltransferase family 4 protein [Brachybacterium sacelli]|uniref:Glycosyltransferase involved in cell wall biosynthesis n=1 Tax=Brachybacterium sacelli TaxID=173364 RepID=A0ABS4WXU4_9MICO|nr:glycosyltransferase family 4 protein [Brachybacterium sacelli]MBP2381025.1 glycosyltransferase involved in cell wall biosynthesis [Brachybacterium sacelli]
MRIAYILLDPGIGVFGTKGASVHVQEVIRALRSDGHEVTVHCTRVDEHMPADLSDLEVRRHRLPRGTGAEREQAVAAAAADIAAEVATGGFDLAYERYSLFSDALARLADPAAGAPVPGILEVNAPLIEEQRRHRHLHDDVAALGATRAQLHAAQVVSCVSPAVAEWARGQGAPAERLVVTPNGVNTSRITPRAHDLAGGTELADPSAPVTVGFVGTLKPWHGTELLLHALARTRGDLRLDICGTGPQQEELAELATELGLADRVLLRGAVAPERVPAVLHGLDLAVAPYPAAEHYFSPLKVYEYLAAGLPVIASAIGTLPEVLRHGELGVLVEPGDVDALAAALDELAADPARRARLGRAAREAALTEHDWRNRCRALLERVEVPVA